MAVDVKDLGIARLRRELALLRKSRVLVGVQGGQGKQRHPNAKGPTIAQIAAWVHYGTELGGRQHIPPRPYAEIAISEIKQQAGQAVRKGVSDLIDGRASDIVEALTPVGEMGLAAVLRSLDRARDWATPLAQSTARAKGHDQPLINTGAVRAASSYTIRVGNQIQKQGGINAIGRD